MIRYHIELYVGADGDWRWRIRHRNGQTVAACGEGYRRRLDAQRALTRMLDAPKEAFRVSVLHADAPATGKPAKRKGRKS